MDRYIYLIMSLTYIVIATILMLRRKDLRAIALRAGALGGLIGLVAEYFFYRDYWRPLSVFGNSIFNLEDVMVGAAIVVITFLLYPVIFNQAFGERKYPTRYKTFVGLFLTGFAALLFFNLYIGFNSGVVIPAIFLTIGIMVLGMRRDLIKPAIYSSLMFTVMAFVVYIVLFDFVVPDFWANHWLLSGTNLGIKFLGVPLTEVAWYLGWASFASVTYPFVTGKTFQKR